MKIKMLAAFSGTDFTVEVGQETERFSDAEAVRMIERGYAVPVAPKVERAVRRPVETRAPKKAKRK